MQTLNARSGVPFGDSVTSVRSANGGGTRVAAGAGGGARGGSPTRFVSRRSIGRPGDVRQSQSRRTDTAVSCLTSRVALWIVHPARRSPPIEDTSPALKTSVDSCPTPTSSPDRRTTACSLKI